VLETLNPLVKNTMKRLSLEELKAKAGKNVITQLEAINGGDLMGAPDEFDVDGKKKPKTPTFPNYPQFPVTPCTQAA
jgi:hypothetical protein